ncbi:peptidylprolyl isomerase [Gordonia liuliyuniae]|uniref:Peptidylprolyl isomerase n=1 Tax=Gordonia liuliyuniae TaxID=2911517 RepID=A0ABS9IR81_9ACTN|nr:peptidylprolyl isomerase [Gordonia liuliyuniae]MCF8588027.1 peptidylprolyl isomerase [Gordonia liuliyuniae]
MSTNEERRDAARRKLEERLEREQQAAKKRRLSMIAAAGVVVVAIAAVGGYFWWRSWDNDRHTVCDYADAPADLQGQIKSVEAMLPQLEADKKPEAEAFLTTLRDGVKKERTSPKPDSRTLNSGNPELTLATNMGDVAVDLDRSHAACNVNAVISLANDGYYNGTTCYRLASSQNIAGLQCGDPTRTGAGSPGWNSPDEAPDFLEMTPPDPQMAQLGMTQGQITYPRGTVAIINSNNPQAQDPAQQANTGNANFIVFTKDSTSTSPLSVIGKASPDGIKVIDEVMKQGAVVGPGSTAENGVPKANLEIKTASVSDDD